MNYLGIDPGQKGGFAIVGDKVEVLDLAKSTEAEQAEWLLSRAMGIEFAVLEKVGAMPKQGVSSTFKFGNSVGFVRGLLVAMSIPFARVTPSKWKREFSLLAPKKTKTQKKNLDKARAQELFPHVPKITHNTADALLIAEYCRRVRT